ncbi:hypothetical protein CDV31_012644 [Fusarium ambrosium]|uniref:HMA domain-containing protein n=1 Tax=Fusarium ambrosium TaxID=131363 RepID=A0A428T8H6_9HYPO|nr:hypothetical protein CDV31_012644 [Fusarium ambrosium]
MACCAVAAYVVFRFLGAYEKLLCSLKPPHNASKIDNAERPVFKVTTRVSQKQEQVHVFNLDGLTCGSCVTSLRTTIEEVPGVLQASISLALLRARVTTTEAVTQTTIINAIRSAGYGVDPAPVANHHGWAGLLSSIQVPLDNRTRDVLVWRRAFTVSALASLVTPLIHGVSSILHLESDLFIDLLLCIAIATSLVASSGIHIESARAIWHLRKPDMSTLGSLGILLSLMQGISHSYTAGQSDAYRVYHPALDSIPILSTSVLGSRLLKTVLAQRSLDFGSPLVNLVPVTTTVCHDASGEDPIVEPIDMVSPGDFVVVNQGQHIPADGVVASADSALITEAWINGSNSPRAVRLGDAVLAGCRVEHGNLILEVKSCGLSTRLGAMLESIVSGELKPQESLIDTTAQYFTTGVIIFAAAACVAQGYSLPGASLTETLGRAVPTCKLLATVRASKAGIRLVTTYSRFRDVAGIRTLLFDKTGTLTYGELRVRYASLEPYPSLQSGVMWRAIWELEKDIQHPVAHAIVRESLRQMDSLVIVAINGTQVGVLVFEDMVRSDATPVIKELKKMGINIGMITGDNPASAIAVSRQCVV